MQEVGRRRVGRRKWGERRAGWARGECCMEIKVHNMGLAALPLDGRRFCVQLYGVHGHVPN